MGLRMQRSDVAWKLVAMTTGAVAGAAVRRLLRVVWRGTTKAEPPVHPASGNADWRSALGWVVASGVGVAVARFVAQRSAAAAWKARTGSYPPALESTA
jgi:Protein of unknown function (DUF4235)